jgi:hypothetical protein
VRCWKHEDRAAGVAGAIVFVVAYLALGFGLITVFKPLVAHLDAIVVAALIVAIRGAAFLAARMPTFAEHYRHVCDLQRRQWLVKGTVASRVVVFASVTLVAGAALLSWGAWEQANQVRDHGGVATGTVPWSATPVTVTTRPTAGQVEFVNNCKTLRLLGKANGQVVLYDTQLHVLVRLPVTAASLVTQPSCAS